MRDALAPLAARFGWAIDELDIDADAMLEKQWSESVPVLLVGKSALCRHRRGHRISFRSRRKFALMSEIG
jgi:hypothetical protein